MDHRANEIHSVILFEAFLILGEYFKQYNLVYFPNQRRTA
jgi:hypothetical protein